MWHTEYIPIIMFIKFIRECIIIAHYLVKVLMFIKVNLNNKHVKTKTLC